MESNVVADSVLVKALKPFRHENRAWRAGRVLAVHQSVARWLIETERAVECEIYTKARQTQ